MLPEPSSDSRAGQFFAHAGSQSGKQLDLMSENMQDLTTGSIHKHLGRLTGLILFGMVFQTLYFLIDLYFVAKVGSAAVAAVSLAGNFTLLTVALTQALTVGTTALVAHAWGRQDHAQARRLFNQAQTLATSLGMLFVGVAFLLRGNFAASLAADQATAQALREYLNWYLPAMGVQFLLAAIGAALRGAGEVKGPMLVQLASVVINIVLAPVLIVGWGTGVPLGVAGAGLATLLSVVLGAVLLILWVHKYQKLLGFDPQQWRPDFGLWWRMLAIGLPPGGEFLLLAVYSTLIYALIRDFGATTQAGFGVGMRVLQTGFMPAMAVSFSVAPLAGQNFGARQFGRVRASFGAGLIWVSAIMLVFMLLCHLSPAAMVRPFASDPQVMAVGSEMLRILSFNFLASGVIFVAGAMFQALGNTVPALLASASRIVMFAIPALVLAHQPWFRLHQLWWLSVGSIILQMLISLTLLHWQLRLRAPVAAAPRGQGPN